jgi:hypothetical protein
MIAHATYGRGGYPDPDAAASPLTETVRNSRRWSEAKALAAESVVGAYKSLARVERAFRSLKTVDL